MRKVTMGAAIAGLLVMPLVGTAFSAMSEKSERSTTTTEKDQRTTPLQRENEAQGGVGVQGRTGADVGGHVGDLGGSVGGQVRGHAGVGDMSK